MGSPQLCAFSIGLASLGPLKAGPEPFPLAQVPELDHGQARWAVSSTRIGQVGYVSFDYSLNYLHLIIPISLVIGDASLPLPGAPSGYALEVVMSQLGLAGSGTYGYHVTALIRTGHISIDLV